MRLTSLKPLFGFLSRITWDEIIIDGKPQHFIEDWEQRSNDFKDVAIEARKIKHFSWKNNREYDPSTLTILAASWKTFEHDGPLMTNVVSLSWADSDPRYFSLVHLFPGKNLRRLDLNFPDAQTIGDVLGALLPFARNIEELKVAGPGINKEQYIAAAAPRASAVLLGFLREAHKLRVLAVDRLWVDMVALSAIAHMRLLKDMNLSLVIPGQMGWSLSGTSIFCTLEHASITHTALDPELSVALLKRYTACKLRSLTLRCLVPSLSLQALPIVLKTVLKAPIAQKDGTLEDLHLILGDMDYGYEELWDEDGRLTSGHYVGQVYLKGLLGIQKRLRSIRIDTTMHLQVSDEFIVSLLDDQPELRVLWLLSWTPSELECAATQHACLLSPWTLVALSEHCHQVEELALSVDLTESEICAVHQLLQGQIDWGSNAKVKRLVVGHSLVDDPVCAAAFLSRIFPKLESVSCFDAGPPFSPVTSSTLRSRATAKSQKRMIWDQVNEILFGAGAQGIPSLCSDLERPAFQWTPI